MGRAIAFREGETDETRRLQGPFQSDESRLKRQSSQNRQRVHRMPCGVVTACARPDVIEGTQAQSQRDLSGDLNNSDDGMWFALSHDGHRSLAVSHRSLMAAYSKILVPIDFSKYSAEALRQAREIAGRFDSELHLVTVVEPSLPRCIDDC